MLTDNEGTVRDVVQQVFASGTWQPTTVVDHLVYSAFGALTSQTNGAYQPRFGYTGQVYDAATGLSYYKARWYDPVTGDFIGQDPKGFTAGDTNLYRYCFNSPTNGTDPSGLADRFTSLVNQADNALGTDMSSAFDDIKTSIAGALNVDYTSSNYSVIGEANTQNNSYMVTATGELGGTTFGNQTTISQAGVADNGSANGSWGNATWTGNATSLNNWNLSGSGNVFGSQFNGFLNDNNGKPTGGVSVDVPITDGLSADLGYGSNGGLLGVNYATGSNVSLVGGASTHGGANAGVILNTQYFDVMAYWAHNMNSPFGATGLGQNGLGPNGYNNTFNLGHDNTIGIELIHWFGPSGGSYSSYIPVFQDLQQELQYYCRNYCR
jgi:RHS repeat-associated protein